MSRDLDWIDIALGVGAGNVAGDMISDLFGFDD